MGSTNELTRFDTPHFSSTARIVTGRVAAEDAVENAMVSGFTMLRKWMRGSMPPRKRSNSGNVTNKWSASAQAIATM